MRLFEDTDKHRPRSWPRLQDAILGGFSVLMFVAMIGLALLV